MSGTIHEQLSDRMPEVVRGSSAWDPSESAHLATCAECGAEWEMIRASAVIGAQVEQQFDSARASRTVVARLRRERPIHRRRWVQTMAGLAAAAAIVLAVYHPAPPVSPAPTVVAAPLLPELDSLDVEELTLLADAVEPPRTETPLGDDPALTDLDSTQLARVLRSLEG